MKILTSKGLLAERLAAVFYGVILSASIYYVASKLLDSRVKAIVSVAAVNSFPLVVNYSDLTYLDYSCLAMFSLSMAFLIFWRENQTWKNALILGTILGLAACSKQLVSYFLIVPCLLLLAHLVKSRNKQGIYMIILAGGIATAFLLVWILPNYVQIKSFTQRPCPIEGNPGFLEILIINARGYGAQLIDAISPLLSGCCILSLLTSPKVLHKLGIVTASIAGVLFMCTISYNNPEARYLIPIFPLFALLVGNFVGLCIESANTILKASGIALLIAICLQYFTYNFTPYPVSAPILTKAFPVKEPGYYSYRPGKHPTPKGDIWGQEWILNSIEKSWTSSTPALLCVVPNEPRYNVHTFNLIAKVKDISVKATTNRLWTLNGDRIDFDIKQLKHYHWYLLKTKEGIKKYYVPNSQEKPKDKSSIKALEKTASHIKLNSILEFQKTLKDGSQISLYRNPAITTPINSQRTITPKQSL